MSLSSSSQDGDHIPLGKSSQRKSSCLEKWELWTDRYFKEPLLKVLIWLAKNSALYPRRTILISIIASFGFLLTGFATNFVLETDRDTLWTPVSSYAARHQEWILSTESGFPTPDRYITAIVHNEGENVLTREGIDCLFDITEVIQNTTGYSEACAYADNGVCQIHSATSFFRHSRAAMQESVAGDSEDALELRRLLSALEYPTGEPVFRDTIYGTSQPALPVNASSESSEEELLLTNASAYLLRVTETEAEMSDSKEFEVNVVDNVHRLNELWEQSGVACVASIFTERSVSDEDERGIRRDLPYIGLAFIVMGCACALYLSNFKDRVKSQSLLGVGAVATILLSIMASYGLLFLIGVPFTSVTQAFPYIMLGIGLDDTFILTGAYRRTNPFDSIADRVVHVMEEVGISITASTLTTVTAFFLGCTSSIPGIRWFCLYAAPTVLIDFIYQITFFIAILAYDDRRIQAGRYGCLVCIKSKDSSPEQEDDAHPSVQGSESSHFTSRLMASYSRILLKPISKVVVLIMFAGLLVLGVVGASKQKQEFDFRKFVPADSYVRIHFETLDAYTLQESVSQYPVGVYFRHVNQTSEEIQQQMFDYLDDLVSLPYISNPPELFWLPEFKNLQQQVSFANYTWNEELDLFLKIEPAKTLFTPHIVRDENGSVAASRTFVRFDKTSLFDVVNQIDSLLSARKVTQSQPLNEGIDDWSFFVFGDLFMLWEMYSILIQEIAYTLALGLLSVLVISLVFIPHPVGALLLTPVVGAIFIEVMAVLYAAGVFINGVSTLGLIMSVGLVVDYNLHVVLTYYEIKDAVTRNDRVFKCLTTMGASILVGGFTTFLGVIPLLLTQSEVARTFFYTFLAIPLLGVAHGLILVPVVLSLVGPLGNADDSPILGSEDKTASLGGLSSQSESPEHGKTHLHAYDLSSIAPMVEFQTNTDGSVAVVPLEKKTESVRSEPMVEFHTDVDGSVSVTNLYEL